MCLEEDMGDRGQGCGLDEGACARKGVIEGKTGL